jgi:hypothetical protein
VGPLREIDAEREGVNIDEPGALEQAIKEGRVSLSLPTASSTEKN